MRSDVCLPLCAQQQKIIIQHKYKCHEKKRNKKAGKADDVLQSEEREILQEDPGGREDEMQVRLEQRSDGESFCKEIEESVKSESGQADWFFLPDAPGPGPDATETKAPKKKAKKRKRCFIS